MYQRLTRPRDLVTIFLPVQHPTLPCHNLVFLRGLLRLLRLLLLSYSHSPSERRRVMRKRTRRRKRRKKKRTCATTPRHRHMPIHIHLSTILHQAPEVHTHSPRRVPSGLLRLFRSILHNPQPHQLMTKWRQPCCARGDLRWHIIIMSQLPCAPAEGRRAAERN